MKVKGTKEAFLELISERGIYKKLEVTPSTVSGWKRGLSGLDDRGVSLDKMEEMLNKAGWNVISEKVWDLNPVKNDIVDFIPPSRPLIERVMLMNDRICNILWEVDLDNPIKSELEDSYGFSIGDKLVRRDDNDTYPKEWKVVNLSVLSVVICSNSECLWVHESQVKDYILKTK